MEDSNLINKGKYALITGGTSGIGYELAKELAMRGFNLLLLARSESDLTKAANEFSQFNVEVKTIAQDLTENNAAEIVYDYIRNLGIQVNVLVNDAGQGQHGKFIETSLERHIEIIQLNITALVSLTHYFLRDMIMRGEGRILQVGSEVSKLPVPLLAVYGATKAFVLSFTEALIEETKDTGVTITLLMPGATDTDFFHKADAEDTKVYRESNLENPASVAKDAINALLEGKRRIVADNAKMNVLKANLMPDNANAAAMKKQMEPGKSNDENARRQSEHEPSARQ